MLRGSVDGGQALARTRSVVGRVWGRSISRRAGSAAYFPFSAALQRPTDSGSAAATTRLAIRRPPTSNATSGRATASRYQRAPSPLTDRTKTSSPSTTIQMIVRCTIPVGDVVSILTSSACASRWRSSTLRFTVEA